MKKNSKTYPEGYVFKVGTVFKEADTQWIITKVCEYTYEWRYLNMTGAGVSWTHKNAIDKVNAGYATVKEPDPVKYDESVLEGL